MLLRDFDEYLIIQVLSSGEWRVGFEKDTVLCAIFHNSTLLTPRVQLDLVNGGLFETRIFDFFQMVYPIIRYSDSLQFPLVTLVYKGFP